MSRLDYDAVVADAKANPGHWRLVVEIPTAHMEPLAFHRRRRTLNASAARLRGHGLEAHVQTGGNRLRMSARYVERST